MRPNARRDRCELCFEFLRTLEYLGCILSRYLFLPIYLSTKYEVSIYLSSCLSYLTIYKYLYIYLSTSYLSVYLSIHPPIHLSIYLHLSICLFIHLHKNRARALAAAVRLTAAYGTDEPHRHTATYRVRHRRAQGLQTGGVPHKRRRTQKNPE